MRPDLVERLGLQKVSTLGPEYPHLYLVTWKVRPSRNWMDGWMKLAMGGRPGFVPLHGLLHWKEHLLAQSLGFQLWLSHSLPLSQFLPPSGPRFPPV